MKYLERYLPRAAATLCALMLALLLADLVFPKADLFLQEGVKLFVLIACLSCAGCGVLLASQQRRQARRRRRPR